MRFLSFLVVLFVFGVSGCMEQSNEFAWPERRPLGQEFSTFQPPAKPMETTEAPGIAEPTGVITLRDALALALMHNSELKAFSWDIPASQARRLQTSLWPNPELGVEVEEVGGPGKRSKFNAAQTTIQLSQLVELGGKREKRIKLASLNAQLAWWDYEIKRLDVYTEVSKAFIEMLATQQRLRLNEELLQLSEELVDTVTKRVDAGKDSPLEKIKASVVLSGIRIKNQQGVHNLQAARKQLASTWSSKAPQFDSVAGQLETLSIVPLQAKLTDFLNENPQIVRCSVEVDKAQAALDLEKSKGILDLIISGGIQRFNLTNENALVFGLSLPLQILDRNKGGKLQAAHNLAKAREKQRAVNIGIEMELVRAYQRLSNAYIEALELDNNILHGAETVFEASKTAYIEGKLGYLSVLDAQRTFFEAKAQYIDALVLYHTAKADVERLIGRSIDSETLSKSEDRK